MRVLLCFTILNKHQHVTDLFLNDPDRGQIEQRVYVALAHTIAEMWRGRLAQLFPDRVFEVGVDNEEFEVEVYAYEKQ